MRLYNDHNSKILISTAEIIAAESCTKTKYGQKHLLGMALGPSINILVRPHQCDQRLTQSER